MHRSTVIFKALVAAQLLATGSLHATASETSTEQDHGVLHFSDDAASGASAERKVLAVEPLSPEGSLLLSFAAPTRALGLGLTSMSCDDDSKLQDIDLKALDDSGNVIRHAKIFLDQVDQEIFVGEGSIYETKIDHGEIVLDDGGDRDSCIDAAQVRELHVSAAAPIRHLLVTPIGRDSGGATETKIDHGVLLIED